MGTAGSSSMSPPSSPRNSPPASLPERRREATDYLSNNTEAYHREYTNENTRQTTRTNMSNVNDEPRSQGPSPYTTLRRDDWWNQRPSAPSLSNLRPPHQETLLTYATQMTGWQSAEGFNPSYSHQQHHEAMELSRVISQLAIANHQLASAHSATLGHLEALYTELRNERDPRRRCVSSSGVELSDEALKKRLMEEGEQKDEEIDERERLNIRIDNTERNLIAENCNSSHSKQRSHRQEEVRHLQHRIERLESIMKTQGFMKYESKDSSESYSCIPDNEDTVMKGESNVNCVNPEEIPTSVLNSFIVPESEVNSESSKSQREDTVRSIETKSLKLGQEEADSAHRQEILRLTKEIERLKDEGLEYQSTNERLFSDLEARGVDIKKLTLDYERTKAQCEAAEASLSERSSECDELIKKFEVANKEIERLRREIDAQNFEKDTAQSRISNLEQGISSLEKVLQKTISEKDEIINAESEKNSKLKAQLEEETADRKKQMKALEDALDEIQRLKETIKTEGKNSFDELPKEDISVLESSEDPQQSSSGDRISNLDEFKKELTVKREARQRAIAAVSSEMERLRRELDAEKEAHSETSRMLELLRSGQGGADTQVNIALDGRRFRIKEQKPDEHEIAMKKAEALRLNKILKVSDELRNDIRFQIEKVDDLRYHLESDRENHRPRITSLTEVTSKAREAVSTRERRANVLKDHLAQILVRLGDRSFLLDCHDDVAGECERQVENINSLKSLYNERLKVLTDLKDTAIKELTDVKERLEYSLKQAECLEEDLKKADDKIDAQDTEISSLESQLGLAKADCRDLQNQMSLINGLFTQMLLGASSADMDLDRLTQLLQENHDLISDMAKEESTEAAALPKLLLDLVEQVKGSKSSQNKEEEEENENEMEKKEDDLQQEDIAHNLPKVWRVLFELLSCHAVGAPTASAVSSSDPNTCYKSVDTPAGPRLVISVSKTYIRLKELILEKKHLEKEMNRMKQLNTHLESKLGEQEKRLSTVSAELTKTWNIVDRMQAQHQQLHTHEKILRYELQQKRKMLQELKQELEYCREKWESARQKNTNTELEWRSLRREFAARKALAVHDSFNNSAESGFSDERGDDTDEEDESVEGRIRLGPRKRSRKESQRIPASDTESEQPTDTELSESKTGSSSTLEKRTPSPETEAELDEIEGVDTEILDKNVLEREASPDTVQEPMDPLDQALTNVIQNLIKMDNTSEMNIQFLNSDDLIEDSEDSEIQKMASTEQNTEEPDTEMDCQMKEDLSDKIDKASYDSETIKLPEDSINNPEPSVINEDLPKGRHTDGETTAAPPFVSHTPVTSSPSLTSTMSVFSIGPVPQPITTLSSIKSVQFSEPLIVGPSNRFFAPVFGTSAPDSCHLMDNTAISLPSNCSTSIREADEVGTKTFSEKHVSKSPEGVTDTDNVSVDSSSSLETVKEFPTANSLATVLTLPASSLTTYGSESSSASTALSALPQQDEATVKSKTRTPEEALAAREDRLKRLEEQAEWLMKKMNATSRRGSALSSRLEELHEVYGEPPVPPPMPDVLPSRRLRTNLTDLPPQVPESSSASSAKNSEKPFSGRSSDESSSDNAP